MIISKVKKAANINIDRENACEALKPLFKNSIDFLGDSKYKHLSISVGKFYNTSILVWFKIGSRNCLDFYNHDCMRLTTEQLLFELKDQSYFYEILCNLDVLTYGISDKDYHARNFLE